MQRRNIGKQLAVVALSLVCTCVFGSSNACADAVYTGDTTPYVSDDTPVDQNLSHLISAADVLEGIVPSNAHSQPTRYRLSDGTGGEMDFDPDGRISLFDNTGTYVFDFAGLGGIDIAEIRAFSVGTGDRASQDFDVEYSSGGGTFTPIITVDYDFPGAANLTRIFDNGGGLLATNVEVLRFRFRPVGESFGNLDQHTGFVELDAFSTLTVPEPCLIGLLPFAACLILKRRKKQLSRAFQNPAMVR